MKNSRTALSCIMLASLAGAAQAQVTEMYASGYLHRAAGHATLGNVDGRKLPVMNIGSSGQDGVEIDLRSAVGGGTSMDINEILSVAGSEIKIKHKGWDGLIYGTHRMVSNGDGTGTNYYDFSEVGATAVTISEYNELGELVAETTYPGPIAAKPWVPDWFCSDGSMPIFWGRWVVLCDVCDPVWVTGWYCLGTGEEFSFNNYSARMAVTPTLPVGTPELELGSLEISARGVTTLTVQDAHIDTFGVKNWGLGNGRPQEMCDTPDCSGYDLHITNPDTSGFDGVAIDVGPGAGQTDVALRRSKDGWDLKENTKFYDDEGTQILAVGHGINPTTGQPAISLDFSGMGAMGYIVEYFDAGGNPLGNEFKNNFDPSLGTVLCPQGYRERWIQAADGKWYFYGCDSITDIVIPGQGQIGPVAYMGITPVGAEYHRVRMCTVTGSSEGGDLSITDVSVIPACPADFDHSGFVDLDDYDTFVHAFEAGVDEADFDGSGFVDLDDFDAFVHAFEGGC